MGPTARGAPSKFCLGGELRSRNIPCTPALDDGRALECKIEFPDQGVAELGRGTPRKKCGRGPPGSLAASALVLLRWLRIGNRTRSCRLCNCGRQSWRSKLQRHADVFQSQRADDRFSAFLMENQTAGAHEVVVR